MDVKRTIDQPYIVTGRRKLPSYEGGDILKKVLYLNYDLSKPDDLLCYQFLISLGRSKKAFVNTLLKASGLVGIFQPGIPLEVKREKVKQKQPEEERISKINEVAAEQSSVLKYHAEPEQVTDRYVVFNQEQREEIRILGLDVDSLSDVQLKDMAENVKDGVPVKVAFRGAQFVS